MDDVTRRDAPTSSAHPARRGVSRRDAFRLGGFAVVGAAVLAACSEDKTPVAVTGITGPDGTTTTLVAAEDADLVFMRTAASLELSAASFYRQVLDITEREIGADLREVSVLFAAHHQQHADLLDRVIGEVGGELVEDPNEVYEAELVTTPLEAASDDTAVLEAAVALEQLAAGAYVEAGGTLSRPDLRKTAMAIGGSDARHVTYLDILLEDPDPVPLAFAEAIPFEAAAELPAGEITPPADGETTSTAGAGGETTSTTAAEGETTSTTAAGGETTSTTAAG